MSAFAARRYTPAEAAALSGVAVKAVRNAISKRVVEALSRDVKGRSSPALSSEDVLQVKLWYEVGGLLSQERRRALFDEIRRQPSARHVKAGEFLIVDVGEVRERIASRARDLEAAEAVVSRDKAVMGGEPVFRGTRIPVRLIASMLDEGGDPTEILDGYPKLEERHLDLARIWAAAYPRRGRPKSLADHGMIVSSRTRSPLKTDPGPSDFKGRRPA